MRNAAPNLRARLFALRSALEPVELAPIALGDVGAEPSEPKEDGWDPDSFLDEAPSYTINPQFWGVARFDASRPPIETARVEELADRLGRTVRVSEPPLEDAEPERGREENEEETRRVSEPERSPDKLPDGLSWYDFTEDTALFEYLTETVGGYFISDITWYADHTWVFFTETEPQKAVYHIMSFDKDYTADCNFVIRDEFGDNISLDSMVLGDRLYIEAYDFASHEQYLYPIDENNGSIAPDNRIVLTKQSQEYESPNR
ncbi:MAG: hypothetical protein IIU43_05450, partial [Thermoguttaceae bacterium]|nr:hypothetical protein [Thermoguttaceae bacterium]